MKLNFFPKTAQKLVFLRKKEVKLFYETKINHEKNYETDAGFTKKVKFHKNRKVSKLKRNGSNFSLVIVISNVWYRNICEKILL